MRINKTKTGLSNKEKDIPVNRPRGGLPLANQILTFLPDLKSVFGDLLQVHAVIDTSRLIEEIHFLAKKRREPGAKTSFLELLEAGTIVGYFPEESIPELKAKIKELSDRYGFTLHHLNKLLDPFMHKLHICRVGVFLPLLSDDLKILRDPNDAPFLRLRHYIGADAVITSDLDIPTAGVPTIPWVKIHLSFRNYSRGKDVELSITLGGVLITGVGMASVIGLLYVIAVGVSKLPPWLQLLLVVGVGSVLIHPESRAAVAKKIKNLGAGLADTWEIVEPGVNEMIKIAKESRTDAEHALNQFQGEIPPNPKLTLAQYVYRLCVTVKIPLATNHIWDILQLMGVTIEARDPIRELEILLSSNPNFIRYTDGKWGLLTIYP
ncbi:MAG: hypothetical protein HY282_07535 [Nitrospirae bacterium]|nr:hypothetical protein [Candidatus Manganitrophaceae bacterium]